MTMWSFADVREALELYAPLPRAVRTPDKHETMHALLELLGNPQEKFRVIHIAGTSGKTSTAYYVAAILTAAGKKTGLTVSPHVQEVNERVQLDMLPLNEAQYCDYFAVFLETVALLPHRPTYFELLTAFAFWVFAKMKVEYAVVEVGIGGLLDATNVIKRHDKICVITDIGFDHTETLGKTLVEITAQKAGIIQPSNTVFMYDQGEEIMSVIREVAEQQQAELHEVWSLSVHELPQNIPLIQRRNWYLAWSLCRDLLQKNSNIQLSEDTLAETSRTHIPGRLEIFQHGKKIILVDGAHNPQKLHALRESIAEEFSGESIAVVFALARSKKNRLVASVQELINLADYVFITRYDTGGRLGRQSTDPTKIAEYCHMEDFESWDIIDDPKKAFKLALKRPEEIIVVTGSFYLIDALKAELYGSKKLS